MTPLNTSLGPQHKPEFSVLENIIRVLVLEAESILECTRRLKTSEVEKAIALFMRALDQGGKIIVTGVGKSGKVGQKIASTLSSTGSFAVFLHPTEGIHGDLGIVSQKDVILALSYTGNTDELLKLIPSLESLGTPIVGLGGSFRSQLAEKCDAWIDASVVQEACPHNLAPTSSTTLALALGDAIAVTLMKLRGFDSVNFAKNHPGGGLGKKLSLTVESLMHQGSSLPQVALIASMDEVILTSTSGKLGTVLVVEGRKLLGIITDGDLRRALKHREKLFELRAKDIMKADPVTVSPDALAQSALEMMENRVSKISVLPVVNSNQEVVGILHIHDVVHAL